MKSGRIDIDGSFIVYEIHGERRHGPPILLLRPLGGSIDLWGTFRELLSEEFRVVSFDYRGFGHSGPAPRWVTTETLADQALVVMESLELESLYLFGISLGGMTATKLASRVPHRIKSLCVASTPLRGLDLRSGRIRKDLALAACLARPLEDVEAAVVRRVLSREFRDAHQDQVREFQATTRPPRTSRCTLVKHAMAASMHRLGRDIERIQMPALVLAGTRDHLLDQSMTRELADALPSSQFQLLDCGHDLTLERPETTAALVRDFFRGQNCSNK